jgi:hypothetical protein
MGMFEKWWGNRKSTGGREEKTERFGEAEVDLDLAREPLQASGASSIIGSVRDALPSLKLEEKDELVDRLVGRLALMVMDLQGSQWHHHSRPYGLLTHLLVVARDVVARLKSALRVSEDYAENHREQGIWLYGSFLMGLLHDLGKILDLEVRRPDGKDRWNPMVEPLAAFCARNGIKRTGPDWWQYRRGRGLAGHAWHGWPLLSLLLPRSVIDYLGHRLFVLIDAAILYGMSTRRSHVPPYAMEIARVVAEVDVNVSRADRRGSSGGETGKPSPLEEHGIATAFSRSLEEAMGDGLLPLNRSGGVYITSGGLVLEVPESLDVVLQGLPGGLSPSRYGELKEDEKIALRESFLTRLSAQGRLPLYERSGRLTELGAISNPEGGSLEGALAILSRDLLPSELPLFSGKIRIQGHGLFGNPDVLPEALTEGGGGASPPRHSPSLPPELPQIGPEGHSHSPENLRGDPALLARRVRIALETSTILLDLQDAVEEGLLKLNRVVGEVFHRDQFLWFRVPESLDLIFRRRGLHLRRAQIEGVLADLSDLPGGKDFELKSGTARVHFHPQSKNPERVLFIPADIVVPPEDLRELLGLWPHPITKASGAEKAAGPPALKGPGKKAALESGPEPLSPETLPLLHYSELYRAIWDLCTLQVAARTRILEVAEEFRSRIHRSGLILFPKRKNKASDYYALFWGRTISALKAENSTTGRKGPKRIEHLAGTLQEEWVNACGNRHQLATYADFDRRRLALNQAYGTVTQALTTALYILRGHYSRSTSTTGLPPLPRAELLNDLSPQGLECVRLNWGLTHAIAKCQEALTAHVASIGESPFAAYVQIGLTGSPIDAEAGMIWFGGGKRRFQGEMSTRTLRTLHIPLKLHRPIMAAEMTRRRLVEAFEEHAGRYHRILQLSKSACEEARELLTECGRILVDSNDQPFTENQKGDSFRLETTN